MVMKNYNIADKVQRNFVYYIIKKEGNYLKQINEEYDVLYEFPEGGEVTVIIKSDKDPLKKEEGRYDLTFIGRKSSVDSAITAFTSEGINLEEILEGEQKLKIILKN